MAKKSTFPLLNFSHILMGARFDIWLRLLFENGFHVSFRSIPQSLLISLVSLLLFPLALLERLILWLPLRRERVENPIFILGHWRSGTTYLHNLLSRDPQLGYFDPVSTVVCHNSFLLRPILRLIVLQLIRDARPMDNMEYKMDLPMEEMLAVNASSTVSIAHMLCFAERYPHYVKQVFVDELPEKRRQNWGRVYCYLLKKQSFLCRGKELVLKSPDSTCHAGELFRLFPDGKFINIYRNPYKVIPSTVNMFNKLFSFQSLQDAPDERIVEETVLQLFKRTYEKLFEDMKMIPSGQIVEVRYEDFVKDPLSHLQNIYQALNLPGFADAKATFQDYVDSQAGYQKNKFDLRPELLEKINRELGFYFEHYGYEMMQEV
ncbi:MAG: sulfotransferase [Bacillota bacterium]|nr:sulfotransferase [Bacillota bacterium]